MSTGKRTNEEKQMYEEIDKLTEKIVSELKGTFDAIIEMQKERNEILKARTYYIINNQIENTDEIGKVFDAYLDAAFFTYDDIEDDFKSLIDYCKTFDKEFSEDYQAFMDEIINDDYTLEDDNEDDNDLEA